MSKASDRQQASDERAEDKAQAKQDKADAKAQRSADKTAAERLSDPRSANFVREKAPEKPEPTAHVLRVVDGEPDKLRV